MADIKLEDLSDGDEALNLEAMRGIYGGAGTGDATSAAGPAAASDPNQVPIVTVGPDGSLPGQGDAGNAGGGGGGGCQL